MVHEKKLKTLDLAQSPRTNHVEDDEQETFILGRPVDDAPEMESCKHCKKNVLKSGAKGHIAQCLKVKKEKALRKKEAREARERAREAAREEARKADGDVGGKGEDSDDDEDDKVRASKTKGAEPGKGGKKRKADTEAEKGPSKKKKKEEVKPKVAKPRGPVDVERQCGVILPNGMPCARSLTCKSHSMGAKRAVPGRSLPYDMLLAAYQKKNQAKQQKAAMDANAPIEDEEENVGEIDSDEETSNVMAALALWNPQPVVPPAVLQPIKRTYQLARLHEQLQMATNGGRTNIFKVVGFGAQRLPEGHPGLMDSDDAMGEPDTVMFPTSARASSFGLQGSMSRRPSVSSRG
ncbi:unnamed protein product [Parascedosporium putredinis]|uniref:SCA7 domain-containing protein n=1 Tax=Parascedosporium putredinis TaxID=1442378 RepID=A0A9P1MFL9_9PEZI|nr:unnamed protein product [Parascedosporium putredinis]CAI8003791.1 unnamed protein product [Parascedosporium putredinis]